MLMLISIVTIITTLLICSFIELLLNINLIALNLYLRSLISYIVHVILESLSLLL
jgi:hypothetical protein